MQTLGRLVVLQGARRLLLVPLTALLCSTVACDRWKEPFRTTNGDLVPRATAKAPLPASGYRVQWEPHAIPASMPRGSTADVRIAFTNLGEVEWPDALAGDPAAHDGSYAVRLAYGWTAASAPTAAPLERRVDLPHPVRPGQTMTLLVPLEAPNQAGDYRVTITLVQELVAWFHDRGATTLIAPVAIR